jgi:hypothetical protein
MPRLRWIVAATVALIILAPRSQAAELLANGDFSAGNSGFMSSYGYSPADLWAEGVYDVVGNPQADHSLFSSFGDHTTGSGLMMVVNGAQAANAVIWSEGAFSVAQNADYTFSFWMASAYPTSPARLITRINGVAQALEADAVGTTGQWVNFSYAWNSGNATTATVDLVNANLAYSGNDFALDDVSFSGAAPGVTAVPEPATWALMILGFGGIGAMLRRWKAAPAL